MMKNWENNGTEEIGLVTPTPERQAYQRLQFPHQESRIHDQQG